MSISAQTYKPTARTLKVQPVATFARITDLWLLSVALALLALGFVMVSSASMAIAERQLSDPFYFAARQLSYIGLGLLAAVLVLQVPLALWEKYSLWLLAFGITLLVVVLLPGIGKEVNGSVRWLPMGLFNLQVSELIKLVVVIYMASYLMRRTVLVRTSLMGFIWPMAILSVISALLLLEPDFGATAVIVVTVIGLLFLAGVRLWQFGILILLAGAGLATMVLISPYRVERLKSFMYACDTEFAYDKGYQLCQALIAFGRGEWLGVGLGAGVQKLFYLPEAHTDFLLAVLAEEMGFIGAATVIGLFALFITRAYLIAYRAEQRGYIFSAYLAYGISLWLGLQAFVNIGVNMGVLPTKGLTLPLMSYGGSSLIISCIAVALLLRVDYESRFMHAISGKGTEPW